MCEWGKFGLFNVAIGYFYPNESGGCSLSMENVRKVELYCWAHVFFSGGANIYFRTKTPYSEPRTKGIFLWAIS